MKGKETERQAAWKEAYQKELFAQTHPLELWYSQQDGRPKDGFCLQNGKKMEPDNGQAEPQKESVNVILFCSQHGSLRPDAVRSFLDFFKTHPECACAYADEDETAGQEISSDGIARIDGIEVCNPWLKPDWSPDTFDSFFYFGNIFALRICPETEPLLEELLQAGEPGALQEELLQAGESGALQEELLQAEESGTLREELLQAGEPGALRENLLQTAAPDAQTALPHQEAEADAAAKADDGAICRLLRFTDDARLPIWEILKKYLQKENGNRISVGHCQKILFHYSGTADWEKKVCFPQLPFPEDKKVSIIIPSKDHPELLRSCLLSIQRSSCGRNVSEDGTGEGGKKAGSHHGSCLSYEILIVDNGSSPENRDEIIRLKKMEHFRYLYEPMEFNFSRMCNLGAKEASGDVLIFLNDDITVQGEDWLERMAAQALCPHTGCVGAKLYYPESRRIQHAGITNMTAGPAHKLGGSIEDGKNLYHMRSKAVYNVIAVTAAALAIEKKKFQEIGGFCEELAVAYNDVDLGFSLYEAGYYNVQRNDVALYHHESVSRGEDSTPEKDRRLRKERELLYRRHPKLKGCDPFYHPQLVQSRLDAEFHVNAVYGYETGVSRVTEADRPLKEKKSLLRKLLRKGPEMMISIDRIAKENGFWCIEGWGSLTDASPVGAERKLLLQGQKQYEVSVFTKYRPDTAAVLAGQPYYELSGFVARIPEGSLPEDEYRIGMEGKPGKMVLTEQILKVGSAGKG